MTDDLGLARSELVSPVFDASAAAVETSAGRFRIQRFDAATEARYLREMTAFYAPILRVAVTVAIVFYFVYLISDRLMFDRYSGTGVNLLILGLAGPAAALGIGITFAPVSDRTIRIGVFIATLVNAMAQVLAYDLGFRIGQPIPYEGLISIIYYSYFMLGMQYCWATLLGVLIVVSHVAISYFVSGMPLPTLFDHAAEMSGSLLIGALAAALLENFSRRSWYNENRLRELAERDPLTGLYNQRTFFNRADQRISAAQDDDVPLTVMIMTIEHLPLYNRQLVHPAVDQCMRELARALNRYVGDRSASDASTDGVVGWLGGEYFALLLTSCSARDAEQFALATATAISTLAIRHPGTASGVADPIFGWHSARATDLGAMRSAMQSAYESLLRNPRWRLRRTG
jgi:diguanylate cyclase (GGDEF)-like protein